MFQHGNFCHVGRCQLQLLRLELAAAPRVFLDFIAARLQ